MSNKTKIMSPIKHYILQLLWERKNNLNEANSFTIPEKCNNLMDPANKLE